MGARHCWGHPLLPLRSLGKLPCSSEAAAKSLPTLTNSEVHSCPSQGWREAIRSEAVTEEMLHHRGQSPFLFVPNQLKS